MIIFRKGDVVNINNDFEKVKIKNKQKFFFFNFGGTAFDKSKRDLCEKMVIASIKMNKRVTNCLS